MALGKSCMSAMFGLARDRSRGSGRGHEGTRRGMCCDVTASQAARDSCPQTRTSGRRDA